MRYLEEGSYFCFTDQGSKPRSRPGLAALASPRCGDSPPHLPLYPPPPSIISEEEERAALPVNDWKVEVHLELYSSSVASDHCQAEKLHRDVSEPIWVDCTKENRKSLKPVSVRDRNKAWINKYRCSFLLKLLWTILIVLLYIFINLLRTETSGNLCDLR